MGDIEIDIHEAHINIILERDAEQATSKLKDKELLIQLDTLTPP